MYGILTNQRLWGCTPFVYHVSYYVYVHPMRYSYLSETLLDNMTMEKIMTQDGITTKHYHTNNDRFSDSGFFDDINEKDQKLTICGVGVHHQNGITEKKNKHLTTGTITLLLRSTRMWPQTIDEIFWPFAINAVAKSLNSLKIDLKVRTPESIFHSIKV